MDRHSGDDGERHLPVTATVTDGAGNVGRAEQSLTVDTVLPIVTIDGGATLATNDSTPTISGVSDVPAGTPVTVTVDAQTLTALVHAGGVWNVTPVALLDGTRTVGLSVRDAAGNEGVDTQHLTVDTTAPAVTITGGATALGNDPTPLIAGTAAVPVGTTVTVDLADETLAAIVDSTGAWSATAAHLADGAHRIVISTADAAGNTAGATQWLTIDTIAPAMTITGGAAATTTALTPTITGTSNAAPNTTVTVTIDTQSMTTLVQGNGTWNATPTLVGLGTWPVTASAGDPAGNVGTASQTLTIATSSGPTLPFVGIDGGAAFATNDRTPTIAGITDAPAGTRVDVEIRAAQVVQTLTALAHAGGTWNVTVPAAAPLSEGTFTAAAAVTDTGGNVGSATQQLTIDTTAPAVTITGGPAALSNDPTPLIAGTAAVPVDTTVTINVANETLIATAGATGAWSTTAATLAEGAHRIVVTAADAAGNVATATQSLTIDTVAPAMTVTGGATATIATLTPTITGTSDTSGSAVTIEGQPVTASLQNGAWSVSATLTGAGPWQVEVSATDPAGNIGTASQTLTIATAPGLPVVGIDGGATVATNDRTPTISGVTDAAAGTPVTVTVDAQTLLALVQPGGAWNVTLATLADGTFAVAVSVAVGGNVGAATQQLTVDTTAPAATITGGATASSSDSTPLIAGTAAVAAGATVTVDVANETLAAIVGADGSWSATAATLADGVHRIVVTMADAAGNSVTVTQWLTITAALPTGSAALNVSAATVGTQLRATVRWSRPATATYRWLRDGAAIAGATTATRTVSAADLGHQLWLVASVTEAGQSVNVTTSRVTPRASSTLSLKPSSTKVRAGKVVVLRGVLRSGALPARLTVSVTLLQKVGTRWVVRRSSSVRTTPAGAFAVSYRVPAGRRGAWRARAVFTGVAAQRPATSPFATFTAR